MSRAKRKKSGSLPVKKPSASRPLNPLRAGMPALDSISSVEEFKKGKQVYRIIHTNEVDEYEEPPRPAKRKSANL